MMKRNCGTDSHKAPQASGTPEVFSFLFGEPDATLRWKKVGKVGRIFSKYM